MKYPVLTALIVLFLAILLWTILTPSSDTVDKSDTSEKGKIRYRVQEYKDKNKQQIDFTKKDEVIDKIIYTILKEVEYKSKTDKTTLKFSTMNDLQIFEDELIKNKEQIYNEAYNKSIDTLKNALKWLNPIEKALGLNPEERVKAATTSLVKNISDKDKIIYSHLYKTEQLELLIKGLLTTVDYVTLIQSKNGLRGLIAGSLLL